MTREEIQAVMGKLPDLNDHGVGLSWEPGFTAAKRAGGIEAGRLQLLASGAECAKACRWLRGVAKTKSADRGPTSYGLKHIAEPEIGYVTNGVFIAAAVHCGFAYRLIPGSINVKIGVSARAIDAILRRQNAAALREANRELDGE